MNYVNGIQNAIEYIETHLTEELIADAPELAIYHWYYKKEKGKDNIHKGNGISY